MNHLLARSVAYMFRPCVEQMETLLEQIPAAAEVGGRFGLEDQLNLSRKISNVVQLERHRHSPGRSHGVDSQREVRFTSVDKRSLEEQSLAASCGFHLAVGAFRNQQIGVDRKGDALQLTCNL